MLTHAIPPVLGEGVGVPTQPGIFHIHIDAQEMSAEFSRFARKNLGFCDTNFSGHPEGYVHFEPQQHLTLKVRTKREVDHIWGRLEHATSGSGFVGYLEAEYVPKDEFIPFAEHVDIPVPFRVERRRLTGEAGERFRQSELHLVYHRRDSDSRLTEKLLQAGLYGAFIPKADSEFVVLTMQGYLKDIDGLVTAVKAYVESVGGASQCTLKEERAIKHRILGITSMELPEIAARIHYFA